jgi:hypothetical protein
MTANGIDLDSISLELTCLRKTRPNRIEDLSFDIEETRTKEVLR